VERVNSLQILREAMQIEKDGIRFYKKAVKASKNKRVEDLFRRLAADELDHLEKLEMVYDNLAENNEWLVDKDLMEAKPRTLEAAAVFENDIAAEDDMDELEALGRGIKAEEDSIVLYKKALGECQTDGRGCVIFKWLLDFEKNHLKLLRDMRKEIVASD